MDGRTATQKVKEYFLEVHGEWGTISFEVERVEFDSDSGDWVVQCAFFPGLVYLVKSHYEVKVSDEGEILGVNKLEK